MASAIFGTMCLPRDPDRQAGCHGGLDEPWVVRDERRQLVAEKQSRGEVQRVESAQQRVAQLTGDILDCAVERDQIDVADDGSGFDHHLVTEPSRGAQDLHPSQLARDRRLFRSYLEPPA